MYLNGPDPTHYLNLAAFSIPSPFAPFGNAGRNIARGLRFLQLDFGAHKSFSLWSESSRLELRAEAFNLLNKTNFNANSSFNTTFAVGSGSYGVFTTTYPPRQIQMALKLIF